MRTQRLLTYSLLSVALAAWAAVVPMDALGSRPPGTFVEVSQSLGVDVTPRGNVFPDRDDWGHGAAFCDYDGDGVLELYVVMDDGQPNRLFELQDSGIFEDIAPVVGCADGLDGRAVVWADYDNDGDKDFFLSNDRDPDRLYQNDGFGNFVDVAFEAGVDYSGRSHSAAWGDYDNDGYLDLFVCVYGISNNPDPNRLYHNNRDGTFEEVAANAGVDDPDKPALAVAWIDYDNDNDVDLYIAYDKYRGNALYRNEGGGVFADVTGESNTGLEFNAMGIAVGDYDRNGYLDMYVTNTEEGNELLHNNGDGTFDRVAGAMRVVSNRLGWGTAFLDYDNDGDDDLYVVNWAYTPGNPQAGNFLFRNDNGSFANVTEAAGVGDTGPGYALTVGDYNNDGFLDMFVNNQYVNDAEGHSVFYENVPTANKWLKIKTVGVQSNRDGIGAQIRVTTGPIVQLKDVRSGSSYLSQLSPEVEFGLAAAGFADVIEIRWPSGTVDIFTDVPTNQYLVANEGGTLHPVPVFITSFEAAADEGGIELSWVVVSDEEILGYRIYRREVGGGTEAPATRGLVDAAARRWVDRDIEAGRSYIYVLSVVLADGSEVRSQAAEATAPVFDLALHQNAPNPFNPSTTIRFALREAAHVDLGVYDARGRRVVTLESGIRPPGLHEVTWDGRDASGDRVGTGIYFYRLEAGGESLARKMVLLK